MTILFDLDGTLIDTKSLYLECFRRAVRPHIGSELSNADIMELKPRSERRFLREVVGDDALDACVEDFYSHYADLHGSHFHGIHDGVPEMLAALRDAGHPLGIVTGKSRRSWEITLEHAPLGEFDVLVMDDDVEAAKPDPGGIRQALRALGADPSDTIYVGDTMGDMRAARAANVQPAAALWAPRGARGREQAAGSSSGEAGRRPSFRERAATENALLFERPADVVTHAKAEMT